ncbi:fibronectin type III domain-containing protein [Nocardioides sp. SR21]|uniref:fibronectin type III domain-containing protein n=1 Tax=Nocardioides sp. SR21 TaxID=2919501 RepID=UPI001FAA7223|nr:fibronectin type III domain-containing protein [Nocardioides sp. SR21]
MIGSRTRRQRRGHRSGVRRRRLVGIALAFTLAAGAGTLVVQQAAPAVAVEAGTLTSAAADPVMNNEQIVLDGTLPPARARTVTLQRRLGSGAWATVRSQTSRANGSFTFTVNAPTSGTGIVGYRVIAPAVTVAGTSYPAVETPPVTRGLTAQASWLDGPARILRGTAFTLSASFHPARPGRTVALQRRNGSQWAQLATSTQSASGTVAFPRPATQTVALTEYRVVAQNYRQAAVATSNVVGVRVLASGDVTPAGVPTGLAGSLEQSLAAADLSWNAATGTGLAGYRVYRGITATGPWTRLTPTQITAISFRDAGAVATAPWYAVTSMDASGNESARSTSVRPEPQQGDTTPPPVPAGLSAEPGDGQVGLDWTDVSAADLASYRVYQATSAAGPWTAVGGPVTSSQHTVSGLDNGTQYWFAITSVDQTGNESDRSAPADATPADATAPPVPTGLEPSAGDEHVVLDWNDVSAGDLETYRIYTAPGSGGPWTLLDTSAGTASVYTATGLVNGTEYWFAVASIDATGNESDRSDATSATPADTTAPPPPTGLSATRGDQQVALDWNDVDDDELDTYRIFQSTSPDGPWTPVTDVDDSEHTVTGLLNDTAYWFAVAAVDQDGNASARSDHASATPTDLTAPAAPTGLTATVGDRQVSLAWDGSPEADLRDYLIYQAPAADGPWQLVDDAAGNSRTIGFLTNGTTYWFAVVARDTHFNISDRSTPVSETPRDLTPPPVPGAPVAVADDKQVHLSWTTTGISPDLAGFQVYVASSASGPWTQVGGLLGANNHSVTGLTNGTQYWFAVTSVDASGNESNRSPATPSTPEDTDAPPVPTGLAADAGDSEVALTWDPAGANQPDDMAGYRIFRSTNGGQSWTILADATDEDSSYLDTAVTNYTTYTYAISSRDETGNVSATSATATAIPTAPATLDIRPGVSTNRIHTCDVRANGSLRCWGHPQALGVSSSGLIGSAATPQTVARPHGVNWAKVTTGFEHTCGLTVDARLFCWGASYNGQLGQGNTGTAVPGQVGTIGWTDVDAAYHHTCAIRTDGTMWCWGWNLFGQVGDGAATTQRTPIQVGTATTWASVAVGTTMSCGVRTDGTAWCWGSGAFGNGAPGSQSAVPVQVGTDTDWQRLSVGNGHTCGIRSNDTLWCWGNTGYGQIGDGTTTSTTRTTPTRVGTSSDWSEVSAGDGSTCGVRDVDTDGGTLWCWGRNTADQAGTPHPPDRLTTPTQVGTASDWRSPAIEHLTACGSRAGTTWCWGDYAYGQVGDGNDGDQETPYQVTSSTGWTRLSPSTGFHSCGVRGDGTAWCWGTNYGQLGDGATTGIPSGPVQVIGSNWDTVTVGNLHNCGLRTDDTLWCWGNNQHGQVGAGIPDSVLSTPTRVGTASDWESLAAGRDTTCGIRAPGTLWCWGYNSNGQVGDGTTETRNAPVQVGSDSNWAAVSGGFQHMCALRDDGTAWCWGGANYSGELGNASYGVVQGTPVQVGTRTDWTSISAGSSHTCATRADGTAWCWGHNGARQFGGPSPDPQRNPNPVQVGSRTDWVSISAGSYYTCGVTADQRGWCWGTNGNGQIGDGTKAQRDTPLQLPGSWAQLDAGDQGTTCGTRTDGTGWCWGSNLLQQAGPVTYRATPGPVPD